MTEYQAFSIGVGCVVAAAILLCWLSNSICRERIERAESDSRLSRKIDQIDRRHAKTWGTEFFG